MSYYITFDGGSGTGKGTVIRYLAKYLEERGQRVTVLRGNQLDPLRDYGARMIRWCKKHRVNHQTFLLPLFAAGGAIGQKEIQEALSRSDFVIRDRSFVTSLGYEPTAGVFTPMQIWDLYVSYMDFLIPDLAIIIDTDVDVAMSRITQRENTDIGLGGKMSGDREHRERIREQFLALPQIFRAHMNMLVISNNDPYTDDTDELDQRMGKLVEVIVRFLTDKGARL